MVPRTTAKKCAIVDLLTGRYRSREGAAGLLETKFGEVEKVNLIATVVAKSGSSLVLDDTTNTIEVRAFDDKRLFGGVSIGNLVLLIARPRRHEERIYLVAEIVKRLESPRWLELRKEELKQRVVIDEKPREVLPKAERVTITEKEKEVPLAADALIALIRTLDTGSGAPIEDVVAKGGGDAESGLSELMAEGEIFEIRPGYVKVLE